MPTLPSGKIIPELPTPVNLNYDAHTPGGSLAAAAAKTQAGAQAEAAAAHELGAGQSGGNVKKRNEVEILMWHHYQFQQQEV
jgi:hypothetical protein